MMNLTPSAWKTHFLFVLSVFFLVFITCKKIDHSTDESSIEKKESSFFTKHPSNDPIINSVIGFVKRQNGNIILLKI
jgi:hypothetical protein